MWNHLNDIAAVCSGVGLAAGNNRFAALTERARRLNANAHRPSLPVRHASTSGAAISTLHATTCAAARRARSPRSAPSSHAAGANCASTAPSRTGCPTSASSTQPHAHASARSALPRAPPGCRRRPREQSAARLRGLRAGGPASAPQATYRHVSSNARSSSSRRSTCSSASSTAASAPQPRRRGAPGQPIGIGRVESPRGATTCIVERDGDRIERAAPAHRLLRQLARVAHAAADNLLPDFPLINKSFELCYACADR